MWNWSHIINIVLTGMLLAAVYTDIRFGKIFNKLTLPCIGLGLLLNFLKGGWADLGFSLQGIGLALVVTAALIVLMGGGFGGGDIKLLAAIGALRGWQFLLWTTLYTALISGALTIIFLIKRGIFTYTAKNLAINVLHRSMGTSQDIAAGSRGGKLPYSIAIALGTSIAIWRFGI